MFQKRFVCLLAVVACLLSGTVTASALEVDCDAVYCFTSNDFEGQEQLVGICITQLPQGDAGTVMLGTRVLQPGDILTAQQLTQMTFLPVRTEENVDAVVTYLPIYEDKVDKAAEMTISIRGKEDKAPVAEDSTLETYKNLPNEGKLKVSDPEGMPMTFTVTRQPKRGTVEIREDGTYIYTPKKNKVGVDSFVFTATDPAGKVSREATVTVQILKPSDGARYTDTVGLECRFEAEWLRNTGLFEGEKLAGSDCFQPEKQVSRGQFLAMMVQLLEIPVEEQPVYTELAKDAPQWLKPYLAAAVRSGLLANWPESETGTFDAEAPITGAEVAVILQNAMDLAVEQTAAMDGEAVSTFTETALAAVNENGLQLEAQEVMNRGRVAEILYQVSRMAATAPGLAVFRVDQ